MQQLTQKLKDGKINIVEMPIPRFGVGEVMVRNYYSLISSGTESATVKTARKSLFGKAKERPQRFATRLSIS